MTTDRIKREGMHVTDGDRQHKIEQYARGAAAIRAAWEAVPEPAMDWRPAEKEWSAREIIMHCADAETVGATRIRMLIAEENPTIAGYDQEQWARALDYQHGDADRALDLIDAAVTSTAALIRTFAEEQWNRSGTHSDTGSYSASDWLDAYSTHLDTHVEQIGTNIRTWTAQPTDAIIRDEQAASPEY